MIVTVVPDVPNARSALKHLSYRKVTARTNGLTVTVARPV